MLEAEKRPVGCHHEQMMEDLKAIAIKYEGEMPRPEMVALVSQFVGGLVFLMDPNGFRPDTVGMMILANVQEGNLNALKNSPVMNLQGSV